MKRVARNTALLLMLAAGTLVLPGAAQQETLPDIYDAAPRTSAPVVKPVLKTAKPSAVRPVKHQARAQHKPQTQHLMLAKAHVKSTMGK